MLKKQFKTTGKERLEGMLTDRPKKVVKNDMGEIIQMYDDITENILKEMFFEDPLEVSKSIQEAMDELVEWRDTEAPNSIKFKNAYLNLRILRDHFGNCRFTKTSVQ